LGPLKIPPDVLLLFDVWAEVFREAARVSVPVAHNRKVFFMKLRLSYQYGYPPWWAKDDPVTHNK
jgi:hypothetical protein